MVWMVLPVVFLRKTLGHHLSFVRLWTGKAPRSIGLMDRPVNRPPKVQLATHLILGIREHSERCERQDSHLHRSVRAAAEENSIGHLMARCVVHRNVSRPTSDTAMARG